MRYFPGHTRFVQALAFSPVADLLASASADGTVRVWDLATASTVQCFTTAGEMAGAAAYFPEGTLGDWAGAVAFSPDGTLLSMGSHDGKVWLYDVESGAQVAPGPWLRQGRITEVSFSPDGRQLAWSSYTGFAVHNLTDRGGFRSSSPRPNPELFTLAFAPDGASVALGGSGPEVLFHSTDPRRQGEVLGHLEHADPHGCWALAYSPNGRTLALALGGSLQLWDAREARLRSRIREHEDIVSGVAFSPDGTRLLSCSWDHTACLYEVDPVKGRVVRTIGTYEWGIGRLIDVAFSADGTLAAAGGNEGAFVVVWDVE
jgi:WD40 repeat protein